MQEKTELPNASTIYYMGIASLIFSILYLMIGLPISILTIYMASNARRMFFELPDAYVGYDKVERGRTMAIIGLCISIGMLIITMILGAMLAGLLALFWKLINGH